MTTLVGDRLDLDIRRHSQPEFQTRHLRDSGVDYPVMQAKGHNDSRIEVCSEDF